MEQEFTISTGWKIFYSLIAVGFAAFIAFLFFTNRSNASTAGLTMVFISIAFAVAVVVNMIKNKIIISDYSITRISVFGTRELANVNVKGFRIGDKAIYIKPMEGYRKITIKDYSSIGNTSGLIACLNAHYVNLDEIDYKTEYEEIITDQTLGLTKENREDKLNKARKITMAYNIIGFMVMLPLLYVLKQTGSSVLELVMILYPLAGIAIMYWGRGLVKFVTKKSSAYYHVVIGMYIPVVFVAIKALVDYKILSYNSMWVPFTIISLIVFTLIYRFGVNKSESAVKGQVILMLVIALIYGYGCTLEINCKLDRSIPKTYTPEVLDKHIVEGKTTSYYLAIGPWGTKTSSEELQVSYSVYRDALVGGHINVYLKSGLLSIPWFTFPN